MNQYREGKVKSTPPRGVKQILKPCVHKQRERECPRPRAFCIMSQRVIGRRRGRGHCRSRSESESETGNRVAGHGPETGRSIPVQAEARVRPGGGPDRWALKSPRMRWG